MNRRGFLKSLAGTAAVSIVTPTAAAGLILPADKARAIITDVPEEGFTELASVIDLTDRIISLQVSVDNNVTPYAEVNTVSYGRRMASINLEAYLAADVSSWLQGRQTMINLGPEGGLIKVAISQVEVVSEVSSFSIIKLSGYILEGEKGFNITRLGGIRNNVRRGR